MLQGSQFEMWECDENNKPTFPLFRMPLDRVRAAGCLCITENLRKDVSLKIHAAVEEGFVLFNVSYVSALSKKGSIFGWLRDTRQSLFGSLSHIRQLQYAKSVAFAAMLLFLGLSSLTTNPLERQIEAEELASRLRVRVNYRPLRVGGTFDVSQPPSASVKKSGQEQEDERSLKIKRAEGNLIASCVRERCGDSDYLPQSMWSVN
jgi:hypothetical protein